MSESDHQTALVKWFSAQYPQFAKNLIAYPSGAIIGGKNKYGMIAKLKREGWRSGVPDLFLALPARGKAGLWIEMKDQHKTACSLSTEQRDYLDVLAGSGYEAIWCSGFDVARAAIEVYMSEFNNNAQVNA